MFPQKSTLRKIINRNTIKISQCCLNNVHSIISAQNKSKLCDNSLESDPTENCSCQQVPCPLGGKCNVKDIVYKAEINNVPQGYLYYGSTSVKFNSRFHIHKDSMRHRDSRNHTALSRKVWQLRDEGLDPKVSYSIFLKSKSADTCSTKCNLCLSEKNVIGLKKLAWMM